MCVVLSCECKVRSCMEGFWLGLRLPAHNVSLDPTQRPPLPPRARARVCTQQQTMLMRWLRLIIDDDDAPCTHHSKPKPPPRRATTLSTPRPRLLPDAAHPRMMPTNERKSHFHDIRQKHQRQPPIANFGKRNQTTKPPQPNQSPQ